MFQWALNKFRKIHPAELLVLSYLVAIGIGTCFLMMPAATVSGHIFFLDALFTATSAVCVTGLIVVDTGTYFSLFGQITILLLIQLGGLGIMTVSVMFFYAIGRRISYRDRIVMQESFAHAPREDIFQLLRSIFVFTAIMELSGTILLFSHWHKEYGFIKALYTAVFHSISAFCNAGFSLFNNSFMNYRGTPLLNVTVCILIILGGIGFPVVYEIYQRILKPSHRRGKLSVQAKSVLTTTVVLISSGMLIFFWSENDKILRDFTALESFFSAVLQSITTRTAGFNSVDIASLGNATVFFMIFLMYVGASPGSCGGGIKTTTISILSAFTWSRLQRKTQVNMFKKTIPNEIVVKSILVVILSIGFISIILFLLLLIHPNGQGGGAGGGLFREYLFEVVSAFSTVGLSMGATTRINGLEKLLIIITMLVGRVGVLTFSYVIAGVEPKIGMEYAEENIMVG